MYLQCVDIKDAEMFTGRSQYGAWYHAGLALSRMPQNTDGTLGGALESGNAKNRVNLARFLCARCGALYIKSELRTHMHISVRCAGLHAQKCESMHYYSYTMII